MEEKLFMNPGSRIKTMAKVFFILGMIATVVLTIIFGWDRGTDYYWGTYHDYSYFNAGLFFACLLGTPIVTFVNCLLLYGFGELIETNAETKEKVDNIAISVKTLESEVDAIATDVKGLGNKDTASE